MKKWNMIVGNSARIIPIGGEILINMSMIF